MEEDKEKVSEGVDEKQKSGVDLDTILTNELGQFGLYQLRTVGLLALLVIFIAWSSTEYIFTTARIDTRCLIPECETRDSQLEFAPPWILNAIPGDSITNFESCQRFANSSVISSLVDSCPATLFNQDVVVDCQDHVYENTNTVVYDFNLGCDEWRRSLIGSARTFGTLLGLPLAGYVSDRWGRRTAIILTAFNAAWLGIVRYWANTYVGFLISEVIESFMSTGGFSSSYILLMELVGPKFRVAAGATMNTFYALGQVSVGLIAWAVPNWRTLTLTLYIPQLLSILYIWLLSESVRWYMSKGRFEEAEKVLMNVARVNRKQLSEESLKALKQTVHEETKKKAAEEKERVNEPWLIVQVFRSKPILLRCAISPFWWITMTFIYYGLTINSVNITGNSYLNYMAVAAVEIPGYWLAFFLMGKVGRKPVLSGAFWICAACQIAYLLMPDGLYGVSLTMYLIGKCSISMVLTSIYVYTAELYPTKHRHSLFAFSSTLGRIGSIVAPLTPAFGDSLPFILFGSFALVSGALVLITPETLGAKFPDTMEEAARIGRQPRQL